jgi:hypothetical protein
MTDFLANQITAAVKPVGTHSAFDHQLLVDVGSMLKTNPWVKKVVQVRRAYGEKAGRYDRDRLRLAGAHRARALAGLLLACRWRRREIAGAIHAAAGAAGDARERKPAHGDSHRRRRAQSAGRVGTASGRARTWSRGSIC